MKNIIIVSTTLFLLSVFILPTQASRLAPELYNNHQTNWSKTSLETRGLLMQSRKDIPFIERKMKALSPWFSFHWKNRIRESFRQANAEKLMNMKPEIPAKRTVAPYNTYNREWSSSRIGMVSGKRKLMKFLTTKKETERSRRSLMTAQF